MNFKMIKYTIGLILYFEAAFLAVPFVTSLCYVKDEWRSMLAILGTMLICIGIGVFLSHKKPTNTFIYTKDGFVIVALAWVVLSLFGALPFVFSGAIPNYIDALFETASGFTTTGASIVPSVSALPKSMLIWRSFTNWIGGMGVLVFVMAIMPLGGAANMHLMRAESPGPAVSKLVPRVKKTALILYAIYIALTFVQFVLLLFGDMTPFEAINAAFSTAGTGGFGLRDDSFLSFGVYSQIIVTVFMLIFSVNFNAYYLILSRKFRDAINSEVKVFLVITGAAIVIITASLLVSEVEGADNFGDALRHAAFTVASIISTSGFSTLDYNAWPDIAKSTLFIITFIGACAGSTGGGLKVSRLMILFKGMIREVGNLVHPKQVKRITVDKKAVSHEVIRSVNAYLVTYVIICAVSFFILSFDSFECTVGTKMMTNLSAVAASINNTGPGFDMVGPTSNYSFYNPISKLVLIFDMLAGRLELLPMLLLFSPTVWRETIKKEAE